MILEFSISNFRSFNNVQTLDFRATSLVSEDKLVDQNNIIELSGHRLLKTIGIYGPNGSGKSNLIKALRLFCRLVKNSLESERVMTGAAEPFMLTEEACTHNGFFQMQLLAHGKKYRYGFNLTDKGTVLQEWLFGPAEKNETWYFKRTGSDVETNKEWFSEGSELPIDNLRPNTLFLTFVSAYNGIIAQAIRHIIVDCIYFGQEERRSRVSLLNIGRRLQAPSVNRVTNQLMAEGKKDLILNWLRSAGLLYTNIHIQHVGTASERVTLEKEIVDKNGMISKVVELDLDENESAGTRKFYNSIGHLYEKFTEGGMIVSDEIDNNFHPSLLLQYIHFFNDPAINTAGAQLLFTSHDTNLLQPSILRRDQVYFTEKSVNDETKLYSLADLKGIRNNADFARQYLAGFYGALPVLQDLMEQK